MKTNTSYILLLLTSLFLTINACKSNDSQEVIPDINPVLKPYYDSFVDEGNKRNINISPSKNFTIKFGNVIYGSIRYTGATYIETQTIIIDSVYWKSSSEQYRKMVIFHEFGHLFLKREHEFGLLPNGEYKSLMYTNVDAANSHPTNNTFIYSNSRWKYYFDELFTPSTPAPEWSKMNFNPFPISNSNRKLIASQEFNKTDNLTNYLNLLIDVQSRFLENGFINIKLPKGFGFSINAQNIMDLFGIEKNQIEEFNKLQSYEIEVKYRLNIGNFRTVFSPNLIANRFEIIHAFESNYLSIQSFDYQFDFLNNQVLNSPDFNIIRLVKQDNFIAVYLNDKFLFYNDVKSPELSRQLNFYIVGDKINADFDLDYYRIYQRP